MGEKAFFHFINRSVVSSEIIYTDSNTENLRIKFWQQIGDFAKLTKTKIKRSIVESN